MAEEVVGPGMGVVWAAGRHETAFMDTSNLSSRVTASNVVAQLDWSSDTVAVVLCCVSGIGIEPYTRCD